MQATTSTGLYLRLLRYVKPHWRVFALGIAGMATVAATEPALPALMKPLIEGTFIDKDPQLIRWMPVIIVSLVENHELGFALGADDYFLKPLDRERFLRRVQELTPPPEADGRAAVLLIDDDPQVHDVLELELTDAGYELYSAASARAGIEIATRRKPGVIILDLVMDGMDGFQAAHALRREPATASTPILVFTSKELEVEDRGHVRGAIQFGRGDVADPDVGARVDVGFTPNVSSWQGRNRVELEVSSLVPTC